MLQTQTFKEIKPNNAIVVRGNERKKITIPNNPVQYHEISPSGVKSMAMFSAIATPGQSTGTRDLRHSGDEVLLVLSGHFHIDFDDHQEKLGPGDSVFIPRGIKHRVTNIGELTAEAVFVLSPPEY
jgi:mannose-6-phosphate isomerase-like protein (cupin superfamily)